MKNKHENYPNKADFEPNIDKNLSDEEIDALPLADPSESNDTESFRDKEATNEDNEKQSAFGINKESSQEK